MKPIIKETLQKKKTKREKISYLAYAYKEWLIAGLAVILVGGSLIYSMTRPKEVVYTVAVVSETSEQQPTQSEFEKAATDWVKQNVAPDHEITVTFVSYEDPAAVQAFTTRLAAGAIQAVSFDASEADMWVERFGSSELPKEPLQVAGHEYVVQITNNGK